MFLIELCITFICTLALINDFYLTIMYEDLETYNGDVEHDMWVDYDYHENTDELPEWFNENNEPLSDEDLYND